MSWGTCYKGSDNVHFNFPPIMTDGRNYTKYEATTILDENIKNNYNINNNSDYRKYLQNNADYIIKNNQLVSCDECSNCKYISNFSKDNLETKSPYIFNSSLSNNQPFGYETSDLKNVYLSRHVLDAEKYAPRFSLN